MNIEDVKKRVIEAGYIPLFTEYKKNTDKLLVQTKEGYLGFVTNNGLNRGDKISVVHIKNPYTIYNIETFIKNNNLDCRLITKEWISHKHNLLLECPSCKNTYECTWDTLRDKVDGLCNNCTTKRLTEERRSNIDEVKEAFLERGYMPLFDNYKTNTDKLKVKDRFGYMGEMTYKQLINNSGFRPFHPQNKYTIENIKLYLKENGATCSLEDTDYNGNLNLMNFKCECGNNYKTSLTTILRGQGLRCDFCNKKQSNLENILEQWLKNHKINYKYQYRFKDCKNIYPLPFDFIIYSKKKTSVAEVHGIQHYEPVEFFGGEKSFAYRVSNDKIKKDYCLNNSIDYIEVSYKDILNNNYDNILKNKLLPKTH